MDKLSHHYRCQGSGELTVLNDLELAIEAGGYVALSGPSGAGKTTLLSLLGGLERPQSGRVEVGGVDLRGLTGDQLAAYRRQTVGFVFQHFGLLGALTAFENVELAFALARTRRSTRRARTGALLEAVGLADRAGHKPAELSGGERQRVAIARALANEPHLLLADEPTGNLDEATAEQVIEVLEAAGRARGCTLVVVTHNRAVAERAPRRLVFAGGALRPA